MPTTSTSNIWGSPVSPKSTHYACTLQRFHSTLTIVMRKSFVSCFRFVGVSSKMQNPIKLVAEKSSRFNSVLRSFFRSRGVCRNLMTSQPRVMSFHLSTSWLLKRLSPRKGSHVVINICLVNDFGQLFITLEGKRWRGPTNGDSWEVSLAKRGRKHETGFRKHKYK